MRNALKKIRRLTPGACMIYSSNSQLPIIRDLFMARNWNRKTSHFVPRHIFTIDDDPTQWANGFCYSPRNKSIWPSIHFQESKSISKIHFTHYVCHCKWSEPEKLMHICVAPIRTMDVNCDWWLLNCSRRYSISCMCRKCIYQLASNMAFTCSLSRFVAAIFIRPMHPEMLVWISVRCSNVAAFD